MENNFTLTSTLFGTTTANNEMMSSCQTPQIEKSAAMWATKPELYLAAGPYCSWKVDVDLAPPPSFSGPAPPEDSTFLQYYYNVLQYILYETGFPETVDETKCSPRTQGGGSSDESSDGVTIALLTNPIEVIGILLEGGRQSPGDMLLVLSMSWIAKRRYASSSLAGGKHRLYVHKAIVFMESGRSALRVFSPPRRATYCINFFTAACTGAMRNDGLELEVDLDCSLTSRKLCQFTDDKVWMRMLLSERSSDVVEVPCTLAFLYRPVRSYDIGLTATSVSDHDGQPAVTVDDRRITVVTLLNADDGVHDVMTSSIAAFVNSPMMRGYEKVVVKPSGEMWMSCMGVSFHPRKDVDSILSAVRTLLRELQPGDGVLVEPFYKTFRPRHHERFSKSGVDGDDAHCPTDRLSWSANDSNSCRFRATVCRGPDNRAHMTKLVCGIGCCDEPLNGDNTLGQSLDTTLVALGIADPALRMRTYDRFRLASEAILKAIIDHENTMSVDERGSSRAQTDLIGIDFILTDQDATTLSSVVEADRNGLGEDPIGKETGLVPVAIEVNSLNCTTNCDVFEYTSRATSGEAFETLVENMIACSQRGLAAGTTIVVWGASVNVVSRMARQYCAHIIHVMEPGDNEVNGVGDNDNELDGEFYSRFVLSHSSRCSHLQGGTLQADAERFVGLLSEWLMSFERTTSTIDGCLCLDKRLVPLSSMVARLLGFPGDHVTNPSAAMVALDIIGAQKTLATRNAAIPQWSPSYLHSLFRDHSRSSPPGDVSERSPSVLASRWIDNLRRSSTEDDESSIRFNASNERCLLESLVMTVGQVHRVDVVIYRRKLIGGVVADYFVTKDLLPVSNIHSAVTTKSDRQQQSEYCVYDRKNKNLEFNCDDVSFEEARTMQRCGGHNCLRAARSSSETKKMRFSKDETEGGSVEVDPSVGTSVGIRMPTALPDDKRDQLVIAAYQCCNEIDLVTGVFTVEMTFDVISPKMIRIIPCLDLTFDVPSVVTDYVELLLLDAGLDLLLFAVLMSSRQLGRQQPVLPVRWSYQNHLGCRRANYGPARKSYGVDYVEKLVRYGDFRSSVDI